MVKWLFALIFTTQIFANSPSEILANFKIFDQNLDEISLLDENHNPNFTKIAEILKQNQRLENNESVGIKINFITNENAKLALKILENQMEKIEPEILTNRLKNGTKTIIGFESFKNLDPALIYENFKEAEIFITNFYQNGENSFVYELNFKNPIIDTKTQKINNFKNLDTIFLNISEFFVAEISAKSEFWRPNVVFFDKSLNAIYEKKLPEPMKFLRLKIPQNAYYMQICDNSMPINQRLGIEVKFN